MIAVCGIGMPSFGYNENFIGNRREVFPGDEICGGRITSIEKSISDW